MCAFENVLKQNGLISYKDHNGTEQIKFGAFDLFVGFYTPCKDWTEIKTIVGSEDCYSYTKEYLDKLILKCKSKKSNKKGIKFRIGQAQRYSMTHETITGKLPTY